MSPTAKGESNVRHGRNLYLVLYRLSRQLRSVPYFPALAYLSAHVLPAIPCSVLISTLIILNCSLLAAAAALCLLFIGAINSYDPVLYLRVPTASFIYFYNWINFSAALPFSTFHVMGSTFQSLVCPTCCRGDITLCVIVKLSDASLA